MQLEDVLDAKQFALLLFVSLYALEVSGSTSAMGKVRPKVESSPSLEACIVPHLHLLLFVHLSCVYELFNGPSPEETVDRYVS